MVEIAHRKPNSKAPLYVALPNRILWHPPISHSGGGHRLTTFEFAVMVGVLRAAWHRNGRINHKRALKAGKRAMQQERQHGKDHRQDWRATNERRRAGASKRQAPAPSRQTTTLTREAEKERLLQFYKGKAKSPEYDEYKPGREGELITLAGRNAYQRSIKEARKRTPGNLTLRRSRYEILRRGGLSDSAPNIRKLDAALDRLCQPVGDDSKPPHAQPLLHWEQLESGRLLLKVAGSWLAPGYERVPLPLPLRSATTLNLYLYVHAVEPHSKGGHIDFGNFCDRLGLQCPPKRYNTRINDALHAINIHLGGLDHRALHKAGLKNVLVRCKIESTKTGAVHITTACYQPNDDEPEFIDDTPTRKRRKLTYKPADAVLPPKLNRRRIQSRPNELLARDNSFDRPAGMRPRHLGTRLFGNDCEPEPIPRGVVYEPEPE
jgi:hypothetical protein